MTSARSYFAHESACIDEPVSIGEGTKIWHFCHVMTGVTVGRGCTLGQNVHLASGVKIGNNVKIQNNVSLYEGVELDDDVFCGPSCVFTNMRNPRSQIVRRNFQATKVGRGASIGANATIVCGTTIGRYAFIAAGAVVTGASIPDYALIVGVPGRQKGWVSRHGHRLRKEEEAEGMMTCPESGWRYREVSPGVVRCLDKAEDEDIG